MVVQCKLGVPGVTCHIDIQVSYTKLVLFVEGRGEGTYAAVSMNDWMTMCELTSQ